LVAARHLHFFGYKPLVVYPRRTESRLYAGLVKQLEASGVAVEAALPAQPLGEAFALGIDAVFGFSFKPPVRAPFDGILKVRAASPFPT
jgi:NAD(P)H-hydrate epimerase